MTTKTDKLADTILRVSALDEEVRSEVLPLLAELSLRREADDSAHVQQRFIAEFAATDGEVELSPVFGTLAAATAWGKGRIRTRPGQATVSEAISVVGHVVTRLMPAAIEEMFSDAVSAQLDLLNATVTFDAPSLWAKAALESAVWERVRALVFTPEFVPGQTLLTFED